MRCSSALCSAAGRNVMTLKSPSGLMALPSLSARFQMPGRCGATSFDVDSAAAPDEKVATAPGGTVSARIGVIGVPPAWILTLSFPLSPRAGTARAVSAAPVRYATDGAAPSVSADVIVAVAGVTGTVSPAERARSVGHEQPTANKKSIPTTKP